MNSVGNLLAWLSMSQSHPSGLCSTFFDSGAFLFSSGKTTRLSFTTTKSIGRVGLESTALNVHGCVRNVCCLWLLPGWMLL